MAERHIGPNLAGRQAWGSPAAVFLIRQRVEMTTVLVHVLEHVSKLHICLRREVHMSSSSHPHLILRTKKLEGAQR